jgi:hypothetical protein
MKPSDYDGRGYEPPFDFPPDLSRELAEAESTAASAEQDAYNAWGIVEDRDAEIERLRGLLRDVIRGEWSVTALQEAIGDLDT